MKKTLNLPTPLDFPQPSLFIQHQVNGEVIPQRPRDGYINATALCQTAGRELKAYLRTQQTKAFLAELSRSVNIFTDLLVQVINTGPNDNRGTWVHPKVAIHLGQWLSPAFAVQVSEWVFDWMQGNVQGYMPLHVRRYIKNRAKIPHTHFSMLNEIYLNLVAPLEDVGLTLPDKMMPDISTGRMFSKFLREKGIDPREFATYEHDFDDEVRPTVEARLYPIKYLPAFRKHFNTVWLTKHAYQYFESKFPKALPYIKRIRLISD